MIRILSICILLWTFGKIHAQNELNHLLSEKTKFGEIVQSVEQYFDQHPELKSEEEGEESPYMHWKRWEWYMSGRLGPQG